MELTGKLYDYLSRLWSSNGTDHVPSYDLDPVDEDDSMEPEWHMIQVHKILHVYWGNERLPLMRYLTVKSFSDLNPDWKIKFWRPEKLSSELDKSWDGPNHRSYEGAGNTDCTDLLGDIPNLEQVMFDFKNPFHNCSDVFKSDYLRLDRLYHEGGFWADMDIVFMLPMSHLYFNKHNSLVDTFVCRSQDNRFSGHSIGFLGAAPGSLVFKEMMERSKTYFRYSEYQSVGRGLFERFCNEERILTDGRIFNFHRNVVYPFDYIKIRETIANAHLPIPRNTIGIHWYAGDAQLGSCCAHVTEQTIEKGGCLLYNEMRKFL